MLTLYALVVCWNKKNTRYLQARDSSNILIKKNTNQRSIQVCQLIFYSLSLSLSLYFFHCHQLQGIFTLFTQVKMSNSAKGHRSEDPIIRYAYERSVKMHPSQEKMLERTMNHPYCRMLGAPEEMQLFQNLLRTMNAKKTLDIGVYTGFSSLSVALALPSDGKCYALDVTDEYLKAVDAFEIWKEAGVDSKIEFIKASAVESLKDILQKHGENSFDFAFIDADKSNYDNYYEMCLKLVRKGGVIAVDNTLWGGRVVGPASPDDVDTVAIKQLNDKLGKDDRVSVTFLTIADGVTLCFKL